MGKLESIECGWEGGNLEDPLVHDDDGDVESPPLEDGKHRADGGGVPHLGVLHGKGKGKRPSPAGRRGRQGGIGGRRQLKPAGVPLLLSSLGVYINYIFSMY